MSKVKDATPYSLKRQVLGDKDKENTRIILFVAQYSDLGLKASLRRLLDKGPAHIRPIFAFKRGQSLKYKFNGFFFGKQGSSNKNTEMVLTKLAKT